MIWTKAVLIFITGTVVSAIVANLSSYSTQIATVSFVLLFAIKKSKSAADLFLAAFLIGAMEDFIEGTALGANFLLFFVPLVVVVVIVKFIKHNIVSDFVIFIFLTVSISAAKFLYSDVVLSAPSITDFFGWIKHNILPIVLLYCGFYLIYKRFLENYSDI